MLCARRISGCFAALMCLLAAAPVAAEIVDPTLAIGINLPAMPGSTVAVPLEVTDSAAGLYGFNVNVDYNTAILDLSDGLDSPDVTLGSLFASAGGWALASFVDDASGHVGMTFSRPTPMTGGTGPIADLSFRVKATAPPGVTPLHVSGSPVDQNPPVQFNHVSGSLLISVPEPASATLLVAGVACLLARAWRRRQRTSREAC